MGPKRNVTVLSPSAEKADPPVDVSSVKSNKSTLSSLGKLQKQQQQQSAQDILRIVWERYLLETAQRNKLTDAFLAFLVSLGAVQFLYVVLAGNYPFNAFLSGFSATVGQFVLTVSLRIQTNPDNTKDFGNISNERAFADFIFGSLLLHFFCVNFIN